MVPVVPQSEIIFSFARSSGPGGQNVNKTATKAVVRWHIESSKVYSAEQKARLREKLHGRITGSDELVVVSERTRSQFQNRLAAIEGLRDMVSKALKIKKIRRPTRPTLASKIMRRESKQRTSQSKKLRRLAE